MEKTAQEGVNFQLAQLVLNHAFCWQLIYSSTVWGSTDPNV